MKEFLVFLFQEGLNNQKILDILDDILKSENFSDIQENLLKL